jgi:hypothetical protein
MLATSPWEGQDDVDRRLAFRADFYPWTPGGSFHFILLCPTRFRRCRPAPEFQTPGHYNDLPLAIDFHPLYLETGGGNTLYSLRHVALFARRGTSASRLVLLVWRHSNTPNDFGILRGKVGLRLSHKGKNSEGRAASTSLFACPKPTRHRSLHSLRY